MANRTHKSVSANGYWRNASLILKSFSRTIFVMRTILRLVVCVALMGSCIFVQTKESSSTTTEKWQCFDLWDSYEKTALVKLTRTIEKDERSGFGEVLVAGVTHKALFRVEGLNRRWDFGKETRTGAYSYAFVIEPDGTGVYLDFSHVEPGVQIKGSQFFNCVSR